MPTEKPPSPKIANIAPSSPLQKPLRSPSMLRLAQLPTVSDIHEDTEPNDLSSDDDDTNTKMSKLSSFVSSRRRTSLSRLPVPLRVSSPPPNASHTKGSDMGSGRKRKLARRPSGLIPCENSEGPTSPPFGSPIGKAIDLSEEEEAEAMKDVEEIFAKEEGRNLDEVVKKPKRRPRVADDEDDLEFQIRRKERKKLKERDTMPGLKIKDITNSPRRRRVAIQSNADSANEGESIQYFVLVIWEVSSVIVRSRTSCFEWCET